MTNGPEAFDGVLTSSDQSKAFIYGPGPVRRQRLVIRLLRKQGGNGLEPTQPFRIPHVYNFTLLR